MDIWIFGYLDIWIFGYLDISGYLDICISVHEHQPLTRNLLHITLSSRETLVVHISMVEHEVHKSRGEPFIEQRHLGERGANRGIGI